MSPSWRAPAMFWSGHARRSARQPVSKRCRVVGDITTAEGRQAALAACPAPDILLNNADGPLPGDFRNWTRD